MQIGEVDTSNVFTAVAAIKEKVRVTKTGDAPCRGGLTVVRQKAEKKMEMVPAPCRGETLGEKGTWFRAARGSAWSGRGWSLRGRDRHLEGGTSLASSMAGWVNNSCVQEQKLESQRQVAVSAPGRARGKSRSYKPRPEIRGADDARGKKEKETEKELPSSNMGV